MGRRTRVSTASLLVHAVLIQAVAFLLRPASTYQALELGVPGYLLGAIGACFAIVPLVIALPVGGLVDRVGTRPVMAVGAATAVAAGLLFVFGGGSVAGLLLANALLGAGHLGCVVGQQTVVAEGAATARLDARFGYYTFAASLGQAIGPAFIPLLAGDSVAPDTMPFFVIGTALAVLLFAVTFGIRAAGRAAGAGGASGGEVAAGDAGAADAAGAGRGAVESRGGALSLLRVPGLARAVSTSAIVVSAVDLTVVYLPALGAERGMSAALVGGLLTVRAVTSMAARLVLGSLTKRLGRTPVMVWSIAVAALALVAVTIPAPFAVMVVAVAVLGVGLGVGQPLTMSWLIEQTPVDRRGRALSLRLAANRVGQIAIPTLMGAVAAAAGAGGVLIGTAVVVGGTLVLLRGVRLG